MGFPEEKPCACEPCDEFALGETSYCIKCTHHNCGYEDPNCPSIERHSDWCDSCTEKKDTTRVHEKWLCDDCMWHEDASYSDYEDVTCIWCSEDLSFPMVLEDGTRVEEADDISLSKALDLEEAYHPECKEEKGTLTKRKEENQKITDF